MKKIFFVAAMLFAILLSGCGETKITFQEDKIIPANDESTWSVLIYACGDNNGKTSRAIKALTEYEYPQNINVLMQTGGSDAWEQNGINGEYIQRYKMQKGSIFLKDQKQGASMGSYETFSDFINWGMETYPADKYMLFVLGDGNGVEVLCDELYGGDCLDIEEMYYALSMAPDMLDAICFDAPHMASLEMATALPNYAKYMVASQEKFDGFDYGALAQCLIEYPMAKAEEVCKDMCDAYVKNCEEKNIGATAQLSVINLAQASHLNQVFDAMSREMVAKTYTLSDIGAMIRLLEVAQRSIDSNMVDLGSLALAIEQLVGEHSAEVRNAVSEMILYNAKGSMRSQSTGLGVCYPQNGEVPKTYLKSTISDQYKQFLKNAIPQFDEVDEYISTGAKDLSVYNEYIGQKLNLETAVEGDRYSMTLVGDMGLLKNVLVKKYKLEDGQYYTCGETAEVECNWEEQNYKAYMRADVPLIRGEAADVRLVSRNAQYSIYASDILFNGDTAQLYIAYSNESGKYSFAGIWNGSSFEKCGFGDTVTLLRTNKATGQQHSSKAFNLIGAIKIDTSALPKGQYSIEFEVEDIYGGVELSTSAEYAQ